MLGSSPIAAAPGRIGPSYKATIRISASIRTQVKVVRPQRAPVRPESDHNGKLTEDFCIGITSGANGYLLAAELDSGAAKRYKLRWGASVPTSPTTLGPASAAEPSTGNRDSTCRIGAPGTFNLNVEDSGGNTERPSSAAVMLIFGPM